ncbi:MAG: phosphopentomutase [Firmicutes bacterium]|nr:phosphopentomutase [Bacillota bacterium]
MIHSNVKRVILLIFDSVGIGEAPDAYLYGDIGSDTLRNVAKAVGGLKMPYLTWLGLGNLATAFGEPILGVKPVSVPLSAYGKMIPKSPGKDTTTGHWEIAGVILDKPFPVYPKGFPPEIINWFEKAISLKTLGNKPASGTEIIHELGGEHLRTGYPIVYTSADSVFQVAAHEHIIPVPDLYRICRIARSILTGEHGVGRVIARPFIGVEGGFRRTERRKDFSIKPPRKTLLDFVKKAGMSVTGIGKIEDIFAFSGLTESDHTGDSRRTMESVIRFMKKDEGGLIIANLIDFDMLYGHRNDPPGYARALEEADKMVQDLEAIMKDGDVVIITADHGCDPTTPGTDHSRENVPVLLYGSPIKHNVFLGARTSFADLGSTIAELLGVPANLDGKSFKDKLLKN